MVLATSCGSRIIAGARVGLEGAYKKVEELVPGWWAKTCTNREDELCARGACVLLREEQDGAALVR